MPDTLIRAIQRATCAEFDVTGCEMFSTSKVTRISHPRIIAMTLARSMSGESFPSIAKQFNRSDHATIISAVKRCAVLMGRYPEYVERVNRIVASVRASSAAGTLLPRPPRKVGRQPD